MSRLKAILFLICMSAQFSLAASEQDPYESVNRAVFGFNEVIDSAIFKPVAKGYQFAVPSIVQTGVHNFFSNIKDVGTVINQALQGKFENAATDGARVVFNSTIGLGGILDVATPMGLRQHEEDFGQTLGVWGFDSGSYVMLPFFGPSTVRDTFGKAVDWQTSQITELEDPGAANGMMFLGLVDTRVGLFKTEELITGDRYTFLRDAYLQRREFQVNDGVVVDFSDDNF